jgi:hypothetical protein
MCATSEQEGRHGARIQSDREIVACISPDRSKAYATLTFVSDAAASAVFVTDDREASRNMHRR